MEENIQVLDLIIPPEADVKLPSPDLLLYYKNYDNRAIAVDCDIDDSLIETTKQIVEYNRSDKDIPVEERKPITIFIMSYGGDLYQAYALISAILASKTPVRTVNMGVAMYYAAGNHDQYFGWSLYYDRFGSSTYSFTITTPNYKDLYIVLETGSSTLGKNQYNWLVEQLYKRNNYRYCIIITHSNFTYQGFKNGVFTQEETIILYDLFTKNNVNMVISGHSHQENDVTIENVRYITTGAMKNGEFGTCFVNKSGVSFKFENL